MRTPKWKKDWKKPALEHIEDHRKELRDKATKGRMRVKRIGHGVTGLFLLIDDVEEILKHEIETIEACETLDQYNELMFSGEKLSFKPKWRTEK